MRVIEKQMLNAIAQRKSWKSGNTRVEVRGKEAYVYLWDNHIADVIDVGFDKWDVIVNQATLAKWPTRTTKSRLRALNANI